MRRSIWTRVLAVLLVVSMLAMPVSAAGNGSRSSRGSRGWGSIWDRWSGGGNKVVVTEPTEPEEDEAVLTLVEDASTVDNGAGLRASTYVLTSEEETSGTNAVNAYSLMAAASDTDAQAGTTVKYFPVTMYNYNTSALNDATHALDGDTVYRGMYFTGGSPEYTKGTDADMSAFVAGQYYIQNIRASENRTDDATWLQAHEDNKIYAVTKDNATVWTLVIENDEYYLTCDIDGVTYYMVVGTNGDNDGYTTTKTPIEIVAYSGNASGVQLRQNGYYLCQWGGVAVQDFGGYNVNNDGGNGMRFYPVDSDEPIAPGAGVTKIVSGYEEWNRWDKASGNNGNGDLIYTGLVQDTMVDDQIVFNVPEGGIFNSDTSVKDIYEYVGLPFVLNTETGVYSFDSDENGVYFKDTDGDGDADPQSGSIDASGNISAYNLYFDEGNTQPLNISVGDGSTNAFFPYNIHNGTSYDSNIDYHFGMRADLPFSMTPNGRIKSTDDESAPITFTFSGDDDVWVFIDGHLVIDLGGIHNRLDATIDFANNTITYSEENAADDNNSTASYNDSSFSMTQQLFTTEAGEGIIPMSRDAFALTPDHEMQVFYLERGEGTSNCRIEFNLPMNDTVLVTKNATRSWNSTINKEEDLTDSEQAVINEIDFGFTLYKKTADSDAFEPVANTNFYLVGRAVEGTVINSTDANGHFYLKNGQSAKFITEIPTEGVTYYVVEDNVSNGFVSPDFIYAGKATYDYSYTGITASDEDTENTQTVTGTAPAADATQIPKQVIPMPAVDEDGSMVWAENKSFEVTVKGSVEANDSIEFICSNYMDATLPNPSVFAMEDIIVLDYGLSVKIDPLVNDLYRGDTVEILYVGGADVTLTTETASDGLVTGKWTEDNTLDFGSVELVKGTATAADNSRDTFIYTLSEQLTEVEVLTYIVKTTGTAENAAEEMMKNNAFSVGKVYIVPATVMYYEEDFSGLVKFTGSNWDGPVDTAGKSDYQEPGVVGTTTDSIYGTDVAYLNDSFDSNGTSYYGNTTNGAIKFEYTFTGTGTTIFARTSSKTGYVQIKLYDGTTNSGTGYRNIAYRDTYYEDTNGSALDADGTLYNIPIYTEEDLPYGTYTVVCTVAKAGTLNAGPVVEENGVLVKRSGGEFYLDGIRIKQPLNEDAENAELTEKALAAYDTDGESNLETVTLRNKLITDYESDFDPELGETEEQWPFAVLTDTNGSIIYASEYVTAGPKEEVYLLPGQSVSFTIKYWHTDGYRMHMGMKAPFGAGAVKVGQTTYELNNTVDCYYDITGKQASVVTKTDEDGYSYYEATYTFTATDKIVSLTNIKIVGNYEFVIVEDENIDIVE